jgi:prophage regulatory protein
MLSNEPNNPSQYTGLGFLRRSDVIAMVGLSKSTIRRLERKGKFPRCIKLTARSVAYKKAEIQDWMDDPMQYKTST